MGWWWIVSPSPYSFGFETKDLGIRVWGQGLTIFTRKPDDLESTRQEVLKKRTGVEEMKAFLRLYFMFCFFEHISIDFSATRLLLVSSQTGDDHQVLEGLGPSMKIHDPSGKCRRALWWLPCRGVGTSGASWARAGGSVLPVMPQIPLDFLNLRGTQGF